MGIIDNIINIAPFNWTSIITAVVCGVIVGIERQLKGKPIGIRTSSLIVLGTYIFIAGAYSVLSDSSDPSRIIGQVISGIGFIGAGVMFNKDGLVLGVTSAAAIWILAAIGITIAVGNPLTAIKLSLLVLLILTGVDFLEDYFKSLTKGVHKKIIKH